MLKTLRQLYWEIRAPTIFPGISSFIVTSFLIATDLVVTLGLFYSGNSITFSHLVGFITLGFLLWLFRFSVVDKTSAVIAGTTGFKKSLSVLIYFLVQTAIRGGSIVSLINFGLPDLLALGSGVLIATFIGSYSSSLLLTCVNHRANRLVNHKTLYSSSWFSLGITLAACVFALRFVFLGAMEVIPQEAYYWNYAQHMSPGYLDHPPLVAATIYVGEAVFGHNAWGTRIGAFIYGLIFIFIFYRYARLQVDQTCAALASVFVLLLPYFFLGTGFLIAPDAPLTLAWAMALYFFYRVLVNNEIRAWYGVGLAMGIGMLSKYTIILLVPAALFFIIFDSQSRKHLLRKELYIAIIIAMFIFSPVIYWNVMNDWGSFTFQADSRFKASPDFYLGTMLTNILAMVTPLPLLALPYLFVSKIIVENELLTTQLKSPFNPRVRLFISSFLLLPLCVFAWNALENEPRYNWTGPLWITILPMFSWLIIHANKLRWHWISWLLNKSAAPLLFILIGGYAVLMQFISTGLPGVDFPKGTARLVGWPEVARNILAIQQELPASKNRVVVAGMDKYFIASKLSYYGTEEFLGEKNKLVVTGSHLISDYSLMFSYWNPEEEFKGDTVIMLSRSEYNISNHWLKRYFKKLSPVITVFPVYKDDLGLSGKTIREYYLRIGYGYKAPKIQRRTAKRPK